MAETNVTFAGNGLVRKADKAAAGPRLVTKAVKTKLLPSADGDGETTPAARSAMGFAVLMFKRHPPDTEPKSPSKSSMM